MYKFLLLPFLLCFLKLSDGLGQSEQQKCVSVERRDVHLTHNPVGAQKRIELETFTKEFIRNYPNRIQQRSIITIPVVVHIIWNKNEENISDQQVLSQLAALNKDFRKKNIELPGIPQAFQNLIADVEIEFCLAVRDPQGNPTTGITRTWTPNTVGIGASRNIFYSAQGGKEVWDTRKYLNMYVAKFAGAVSGISSFPDSGPASEDAVVINYLNFGTINVKAPYHLGRTATHEIGHFFNLEHPWGPRVNDCCADDFVADTPPSCSTYLDKCPTHPVVSCTLPDMFMNYMFYTDDACMGMFSLGQKLRMLAALNGSRPGLLSSDGCKSTDSNETISELKLGVYPNPVRDRLFVTIDSAENLTGKLSIVNTSGIEVLRLNKFGKEPQGVDTSVLPPGTYFMSFVSEKTRLRSRFIKL